MEGTLARPTDQGVAALSIERLSHAFGARKVLKEVGFTIEPGQFTVLLGPNGAGKTTLFSLVARLYHATSGAIRVFGIDVRRQPSEALARMGIVFQQPTLDLDLSVEDNLFYHAALHGLSHRLAAVRMAAELARFGIAERRRDRVRQLSGGQRRRVEVVRALLHQPVLLLLDEPTVGLDVASRQYLLDHVRALCREQRIGVLWATHLIDEVADDARVIVLHRGTALAQGPVRQIVREAGAETLREAFDRLTREDAP